MVGRSRSLHQPDYKNDTVYLFQFPRSTFIPNIASFCLKVETWMRMNNLNYEAIPCDLFTSSKRGQLPFIELNGKEISDSNTIIHELAKHFNKEGFEAHLGPVERATARAFESLLDDTIYWVVVSLRAGHCDQLLNDNATLRIFPAALRAVRGIASRMMANKLKTKSFHQGTGRHNTAEIVAIGQEALQAFSVFLGDKPYLMGDKPTKVDATAFGHISQLWYTPIETDLKKFLESDCQNIVQYLERIKSAYWADWAEVCRAQTKPAKEKSIDNTAAKVEPNATAEDGEKTTGIVEEKKEAPTNQDHKKTEEKPTTTAASTAPTAVPDPSTAAAAVDEKAKETPVNTIAPVAELPPTTQCVAVEAQ